MTGLAVYEEIDEIIRKHQERKLSSFYSARDTGEMAISPRDVLGYVSEIRCSIQYGMGVATFIPF